MISTLNPIVDDSLGDIITQTIEVGMLPKEPTL
jgi:hypothetical protein